MNRKLIPKDKVMQIDKSDQWLWKRTKQEIRQSTVYIGLKEDQVLEMSGLSGITNCVGKTEKRILIRGDLLGESKMFVKTEASWVTSVDRGVVHFHKLLF